MKHKEYELGKAQHSERWTNQFHIDILGISELKWTGIGHLQSGDHPAYYLEHEKPRNGFIFIIKRIITKTVLE